MRSIFSVALIATVFFGSSYFYYSFAAVCSVPVEYTLGELDERFGISRTEARVALSEAEAVWENGTGRNLFVYDDASPEVTVDFIFDERQERTLAEEAMRDSLDRTESASARLGDSYETLSDRYESLKAQYDQRVAAYESRLAQFNQMVERYNQTGGAPQAVYQELQEREAALNRQSESLNQSADRLNALVDRLNNLSERGNELVERYNDGVETYNTRFGETEEFTQGNYQENGITVYKFSDKSELVRVLAHEFGHSLGIGHVDGPASVMYYLMDQQPETLTLSEQDLEAFRQTCGSGNAWTRLWQRAQAVLERYR